MKRIIPFLLAMPLMAGCTISTETANHIANALDNLGLTATSNSFREYAEENAEYQTVVMESNLYSLDASAYATGTIILSDGEKSKIYSPTVGEIEFGMADDQIYREGNVFYIKTGTKMYEDKEKETIISVEIDKTQDSAVSIANGSYESISEEYCIVSFKQLEEDNTWLLIVRPSEHYEHYWYIHFKEINGETYYTSIVTMGYPEEESEEIYNNLMKGRVYPDLSE